MDEKARRLAYLDNRASELGLAWDTDQLLADLQGGVDLAGIFDRDELAELLAGLLAPTGLTDPDEVPKPPEAPVSRPGDLWLLGATACSVATPRSQDDVRAADGRRARRADGHRSALPGRLRRRQPSPDLGKDGDGSAERRRPATGIPTQTSETTVAFYGAFLRVALSRCSIQTRSSISALA